MALIRTPDPNRSTSVNFVHVSGRSLYIIDRRVMVVKAGKCSTPCKKEGRLSGKGNVRGICLGRICSGKCSGHVALNYKIMHRPAGCNCACTRNGARHNK